MLFNRHDQVHIYCERKYHYHFRLIVCTFWFDEMDVFFSLCFHVRIYFVYFTFEFSERSSKKLLNVLKNWTIVKLEFFFLSHCFPSIWKLTNTLIAARKTVKWQHMPKTDAVSHIGGNWNGLKKIVYTRLQTRWKMERNEQATSNQYTTPIPVNECVAFKKCHPKSQIAHTKTDSDGDCIRSCPKFGNFVCIYTHFWPLGFLAAVMCFCCIVSLKIHISFNQL